MSALSDSCYDLEYRSAQLAHLHIPSYRTGECPCAAHHVGTWRVRSDVVLIGSFSRASTWLLTSVRNDILLTSM